MKVIRMAAHAAAIAGLMTGAVFAQGATSAADQKFAMEAAQGGMAEVELGRLATQKASSDDVKKFGQRMVDDHTKTTKELKALIADKDIKAELPSKLDPEHRAMLDKLTGLSGNQFDKTYMQGQVKGHEKAVSLFEAYAAAGENADLKSWANDTLPTLKDHLKEAKNVSAQVDQVADAGQSDNMAADHDKMKNADHEQTASKAVAKGNIKYVTRQAASDWTAEALIGRTVENANGDNLGDINNVIINEKGDVVAVVIGVGGFLGIGEKNVGVPFDALEFRTEAAMKDHNGQETKAERKADEKAARADTEHDNMVIVLSTTKEDLEAAPEFAWLDQQGSKREQSVQ
jgi:putative membrane protein